MAPLARVNRLLIRLLGWIRAVVVAPFQLSIPRTSAQTLNQRETERRARLVRLIISFLTAVQLFIGVPAAILNATPVPILGVQLTGVIMGVICLYLNQRRRTTLAGALYVYPAIGFVFVGAFLSAHYAGGHIDARSLLAYCLETVFILLVGLLLPLRMLWPTTLIMLGIMTASVLLAPLMPGPGGENQQALLIIFLGLIYSSSAALSWIASRSARAGMEAIERALDREREMTTLKDLFLTDANHELRTPLMTLYNDVKMMERLGEHANPDVRKRLLTRALHSGDQLLRLLNTVLDARIIDEATRFPLNTQTVLLAPIVREVLETFNPHEIGESWPADQGKHQARDVFVTIAPTLTVAADVIRLRQVLVNLISNAMKYSSAGAPISIAAVTCAERRPGAAQNHHHDAPEIASQWVQVSIQDHGLGIPPDEIPLLFNRFVRLSRDIAGSVRGTGLGLFICRRLIQAMDGEIWVESSGVAGKGSTFFFTLPMAELQ